MTRSAGVAGLVLAGLSACTTTSAQALAPTLDELVNAAYSGLDERPGAVTLHDGRWTGEPVVAGGASRPMVELAGDLRVTGDLDGDGQPEAVAILAYSAGGSGVLSYLSAIAYRSDRFESTRRR